MKTLDELINDHPQATAAELVAFNDAQPPEWADVLLTDVFGYLVREGLLSVFRAVAAGPTGVPAELSAGVADLFDAPALGLATLELTNPTIRGRWLGGIAGLLALGRLSDAQAGYLAGLGRTDPEAVTVEQAAARLTQRRRSADVAAIRSRVLAYLNDSLNVAEADPAASLVPPEQYFAGQGA